MKVNPVETERDLLLQQLRKAVALQIELWDVTLEMAERLECENLEQVMDGVQELSISAETGLELDCSDLDDLLRIGARRIKYGRPLDDYHRIQ